MPYFAKPLRPHPTLAPFPSISVGNFCPEVKLVEFKYFSKAAVSCCIFKRCRNIYLIWAASAVGLSMVQSLHLQIHMLSVILRERFPLFVVHGCISFRRNAELLIAESDTAVIVSLATTPKKHSHDWKTFIFSPFDIPSVFDSHSILVFHW